MPTIVDSHHKVLLAWAEYRSKLSDAPRLITLDHHTDTSPPFRRFIKKLHFLKSSDEGFNDLQSSLLENINFNDSESVRSAIDKLNNDEHVVAAIKTNIISSAFVLAHNAANTNFDIYKEHRISCRTVTDHDSVLESSVLDEALIQFNMILDQNNEQRVFDGPYVLDVDLDYFNTYKSVDPEDSKTFQKLIENAGLITIATEPEYVTGCALDKGLTSDFLLDAFRTRFL
jgi:hypothetical protein